MKEHDQLNLNLISRLILEIICQNHQGRITGIGLGFARSKEGIAVFLIDEFKWISMGPMDFHGSLAGTILMDFVFNFIGF